MVSPGQQSMLVYPRSWDSGKITGKRGFFNGPYGGFRKKNNPKNRWPLPWGLQSALSFCRLPPLGGLRKAARRGLRTLLEGLGIMLYPCCLACFSWWLWLFTSDFWCLIHFVDTQTWLVYRYIYIYHIIYIYISHACWLYHYKTWIVSLEKTLQHQNFAWKTALFHWIEFTWTASRLWRTNPSP